MLIPGQPCARSADLVVGRAAEPFEQGDSGLGSLGAGHNQHRCSPLPVGAGGDPTRPCPAPGRWAAAWAKAVMAFTAWPGVATRGARVEHCACRCGGEFGRDQVLAEPVRLQTVPVMRPSVQPGEHLGQPGALVQGQRRPDPARSPGWWRRRLRTSAPHRLAHTTARCNSPDGTSGAPAVSGRRGPVAASCARAPPAIPSLARQGGTGPQHPREWVDLDPENRGKPVTVQTGVGSLARPPAHGGQSMSVVAGRRAQLFDASAATASRHASCLPIFSRFEGTQQLDAGAGANRPILAPSALSPSRQPPSVRASSNTRTRSGGAASAWASAASWSGRPSP